MTDKQGWGWWAGRQEEWMEVGPCATRDEAISEAIGSDCFCEFQDDAGTWSISMHVCEARTEPLRISDWIGADNLPEMADERILDSDRVDTEHDDGPWFEVTAGQRSDLEERVKRACDEWQRAHGLVFVCQTFNASRNHETVVVNHPRDKDANT